jgi:hypothetical protein
LDFGARGYTMFAPSFTIFLFFLCHKGTKSLRVLSWRPVALGFTAKEQRLREARSSSVQCSVFSVQWAVFSLSRSLSLSLSLSLSRSLSDQCAVSSVQWAVFSGQWAVCSKQCSVAVAVAVAVFSRKS